MISYLCKAYTVPSAIIDGVVLHIFICFQFDIALIELRNETFIALILYERFIDTKKFIE